MAPVWAPYALVGDSVPEFVPGADTKATFL